VISGLVIHLTAELKTAESALAKIGENSSIEAGELLGCRLPVVVEADGTEEMHGLTDWLTSLSGVEHVDVAFTDVEQSVTAGPSETETQV